MQTAAVSPAARLTVHREMRGQGRTRNRLAGLAATSAYLPIVPKDKVPVPGDEVRVGTRQGRRQGKYLVGPGMYLPRHHPPIEPMAGAGAAHLLSVFPVCTLGTPCEGAEEAECHRVWHSSWMEVRRGDTSEYYYK